MKLYRLSRGSLNENAVTTIGTVEVKETSDGKHITRSNARVKGIDEPYISVKLIVYSESKDTKKLDRLCAKIRKAVEEYKKR